MEASIVDLRRKMSQVLRAIDRNETVTVTYRGRKKAVMYPVSTAPPAGKELDPADHPAFGMWADRQDMQDVDAYMRKVRKGRNRVV